MKQLFGIFSLIVLVSACASKSEKEQGTATCADHHTGTYVWQDQSGQEFRIERTKDRQRETSPYSDTVSVYSVEWIDECTYRLQLLEGDQAAREFHNNTPTMVTLTLTNEDSYEYALRSPNLQQVVRGKLIKEKSR
ncbi:MAG: hypothetical protein AAF740_06585 [Bacteroidota bacterium]